jgi:cytidylate kinase
VPKSAPAAPRAPNDTRRVVVVGAAGAGKSTLAQHLASALDLRVVHLDNVAAADGHADLGRLYAPPGELPQTVFRPRPLDERRRIIGEIANGPAWVVEGAFVDWLGPLFERADTIVWLDTLTLRGSLLALAQRVRRTRARSVEERSRRVGDPGGDGIVQASGDAPLARVRRIARNAFVVLREAWAVSSYFVLWTAPGVERDIAANRWDRITRETVARALAPHGDKVVRLGSPDAVRAWEIAWAHGAGPADRAVGRGRSLESRDRARPSA